MKNTYKIDEFQLIYDSLKKVYSDISDKTNVPYAGRMVVSSLTGSMIQFGYNMPDKQILLTITEEKKVTITIKIGVLYQDANDSIDILEVPEKTIYWKWLDLQSENELFKIVEIFTKGVE